MKILTVALVLLLSGSCAFAQSEPLDDITAGYYACVSHQQRIVPAPTPLTTHDAPPPTTHDFRYDVPWAAEKCPDVVAKFLVQESAKRAARGAADLEKVNKALKPVQK